MLLSESPGTIVLPTNEIGRYTMFMMSLASTQQPMNTNLSVMASVNVVENLNQSIRELRPEDRWAWVIGDDHVWSDTALMRLLQTMDDNPPIDILVPLVSTRNPPWYLVVFHAAGVFEDGVPRWKAFNFDEIPETGIFKVDAAGSAGMLIRREVLDEMGDPWFENSNNSILNEDLEFCRKAAELGFNIYATADVSLGHLGIFNVRPMRKDGKWGALTEFSSPNEQFKHIFMPVEDVPEVAGVAG